MEQQKVMFKNIHYNARSNKIVLWWNVNGKNIRDTFDYEHEYYQVAYSEEDIKASTKQDLFGRPMTKKVVERRRDMPKLVENNDIAEGDLKEETKFLHKFFGKYKCAPNIDELQIMYYDIEVAIGHSSFSKDTQVQLADGSIVTILDIETMPSKQQRRLEVKDPKTGAVSYYPVSVYAGSAEFPKPKYAAFPVNAIAQFFTKEQKLYLYADKDFRYVKEHTINEDGNKIPKTYGSIDDMKIRLQQETGIKPNDIVCYVIADEKELLERFIKTMHKHKTDVISGWNTDRFDNPYVSQRLLNLNSLASFSPIKQQYSKEGMDDHIMYSYKGISSLDYLKVYRDKFTFDNKGYYSLDNIVGIELKKSKLAYDVPMKEFYQDYWDDFMLYNAIDTMLVAALDKKKGFMNLALMAAHSSLIPLESIMGTVQGLDGLIQSTLNKKNVVYNNRDTTQHKEKFPGGFSWCSPGLYHYGVSFDVQSQYPHFLMCHNVSVETLHHVEEDEILPDVVRINDTVNRKAYFFWPDHELQVFRDGDIAKVRADSVLPTDSLILRKNENGVNFEGQPNWTHDIGMEHSELLKNA